MGNREKRGTKQTDEAAKMAKTRKTQILAKVGVAKVGLAKVGHNRADGPALS